MYLLKESEEKIVKYELDFLEASTVCGQGISQKSATAKIMHGKLACPAYINRIYLSRCKALIDVTDCICKAGLCII